MKGPNEGEARQSEPRYPDGAKRRRRTALAIYMRDRHPELDMEYVFIDTPKELPETYEYLARLEAYLRKRIIRLTTENGGFDYWWTVYPGVLPSPSMRWCTRRLKIEPLARYVGDNRACSYVAICADEARRGHILTNPNVTTVYPFVEDGITRADLPRILDESGVGLPAYRQWRRLPGCYFCFFQSPSEWLGLLDRHPDLYEQAMQYEKPLQCSTWLENESLDELRRPERVRAMAERASG